MAPSARQQGWLFFLLTLGFCAGALAKPTDYADAPAPPIGSMSTAAAKNQGGKVDARLMLVAFDPTLAPLAEQLKKVLEVRMARFGVSFLLGTVGERAELGAGQAPGWVVGLRKLSRNHVIVSVESHPEVGDVSEVRMGVLGANQEDLAWTLGLLIEETLAPYLDANEEMAALGAGLAIIEPDIIGGSVAPSHQPRRSYPRFGGLGLGLNLMGLWSIDEIMVGPRLFIKGIFTVHTLISFQVGWSGSARYAAGQVTGLMSQVPIDLDFGFRFVNVDHLEVVGWGGLSMGFAIYKNNTSVAGRTDMTFVPGGNLMLEIGAHIRRPWLFFVKGGCNFPFVRDILVNQGDEVYSHVWVVPTVTLGIQMIF